MILPCLFSPFPGGNGVFLSHEKWYEWVIYTENRLLYNVYGKM